MANSPKGSGNPLLPIAIIGVVVVAILVGVFAIGGDETPPDQPTIIAEDDVEGEPAGAGTAPEGEADEVEEGITEQVDDVEPAAEGEETIPAADRVETSGSDTEGETDADETVADTAMEEGESDQQTDSETRSAISTEATQAGGADGEQSDDPAASLTDEPANQSATEEFLLDEETVGSEGAENVDTPATSETSTTEALPQGRDAQTNLDPSDCQDVVQDTDNGGAAFIPTPSGPDQGFEGDCLNNEQQ